MKIKSFALTVLSFTFLSTQTNAAGFYIQEQSVSGLGKAFAGMAATADDASVIYYNPAGMTDLEHDQGHLGVQILAPNAELTDTGSTVPGGGVVGGSGDNPYGVEAVPNLHIAKRLSREKVWAGISVTAPFGLGSEYDDDWFGRYDSLKTDLKVINIQPSIAVKVNEQLSIGGGIDIQKATADLTSAAFATTEGISRLEGDDWSVGYNVGAVYKPNDQLTLGAHYRYGVRHVLDGRISATGTGGSDFNAPGTASLHLPDIASLAVAYDMMPGTRLMMQGTWFGWNSFSAITAITDTGTVAQNVRQGYRNTWAVAVGIEHELNQNWTVRAGYQYDDTPTVDQFRTSRTPDGNRNWVTVGATYDFNEKTSLDMAAGYINVDRQTINVQRNQPLTSTISADTEGHVGLFAIGINHKF